MEKLWSTFEERSTDNDVDVEIVKELFFSPKHNIGQIRELFESWSIEDLQSTVDQIYYSSSMEDEAEVINQFGEADYYSHNPFRESAILQSIGDQMWSLCSRKKKFF